VSRSLSACEGALLIIDAAQGVEAQRSRTCIRDEAELKSFRDQDRRPHADVAQTKQQLEDISRLADTATSPVQKGIGIDDSEAIIAVFPPKLR
jgi:GTP-binding protein LepA